VRELEENITIGIELDNITFSFRTDADGSNVRTNVKAIKEMASKHAQLFKSLHPGRLTRSSSVPRVSNQSQVGRRGRAETSLILNRLEELLIPRGHFKTARTTGDVKAELEKQAGVPFTSRKVSQALGVLFKKGHLSRVGSKGDFRYIQQ
jgi:hypothetical protein